VVLAEGATRDGLRHLVERLHDAVVQPISVGSLTLKVGVSIGLAESVGGEADAAGLLVLADKAMYSVKRQLRRE
jgi:GGDEF domain-containing protein